MPVTTINGYQHFYEDVGSGEPALLLHGNMNSSAYFQTLIPDLAKDFRVIAPHLRGMGFSEHQVEMTPNAFVEDTLALMNQLGIESAHFYGVSLGSLIAMRIALEQPQRVRTLTLESPVIAIDPTPPPAPSQPRREPPPRVIEEFRAMHGEDWRTVIENCDRWERDPELRAAINLGEAVAAITSPSLIIRGDIEESFHPLMHAIELHELLPNSWLWISPHSRSLLTRRHPGDSAGVFRNFVSESAGAAASEDPAVHDVTELLARVDLFARLERGALVRLAGLAKALAVAAGETVFRQGDPGDAFYVVTQGMFDVFIAAGGSQGEVAVRHMGPGEYFGEMALLTNDPRSATIRAASDGGLLQIGQTHFRALLHRDAVVATAIAAALSRRMRTQNDVVVAHAVRDSATTDQAAPSPTRQPEQRQPAT
ncbi:MAG: alpha/beta fold hydrolase [Dehalococcoidia bacterium]